MLFHVGIELPKKSNQAYGLIVPVFSKFNYLCITTAEHKQQIIPKAKEMITVLLEEAFTEGYTTEVFELGTNHYQQSSEYQHFQRWIIVQIDINTITPLIRPIQLQLPKKLLIRVDAYINTYSHRYRDRTHFFTELAYQQIRKI